MPVTMPLGPGVGRTRSERDIRDGLSGKGPSPCDSDQAAETKAVSPGAWSAVQAAPTCGAHPQVNATSRAPSRIQPDN